MYNIDVDDSSSQLWELWSCDP